MYLFICMASKNAGTPSTKKPSSKGSARVPKKSKSTTTSTPGPSQKNMKKTANNSPKPLQNWDIDIWYAAIVLLICGYFGKLFAEHLTNEFVAGFSIGIVNILMPIALSLVFSYFIKKFYYEDEQKNVNSTLCDFLFTVVIVLILALLCQSLLGERFLLITASTIVGLVISYLRILNKVMVSIKQMFERHD